MARGCPVAASIDTLISRGTTVAGDLEFSGGLHLDGSVAGDVRAKPHPPSTLSVSENGSIGGAVEAANVFVDGMVKGGISAFGRVVLGPAARVHGDVRYGTIEMAQGAYIQGRLIPVSIHCESGREAAERT